MSLFRLATPFYPECICAEIKTNLFPAIVNSSLTAPLLPIILPHPVATVSEETLVMRGISLTCAKTQRWVAWSETEPTMANSVRPRLSWIIWFMAALEGLKMEPMIELSASCEPITYRS